MYIAINGKSGSTWFNRMIASWVGIVVPFYEGKRLELTGATVAARWWQCEGLAEWV